MARAASYMRMPIKSSSLICLRSVNSVSKLVCIPGAGGNVTSFMDLLNATNSQWAIYGFQPRGIDLSQEPDKTVEETAHLNLVELSSIMGSGEIHLAGHSYGGLVAYEMALRLSRAGRPAASLTMIDTEAPAPDQYSPDYSTILTRFATALSEQFEINLKISDNTVSDGDVDTFVGEIHLALRKHKIVSSRTAPSMLKGPLATFTAALRQNYSPAGCYEGRVNLALASEAPHPSDVRPDRHAANVAEWRVYIADLRVKQMPGNHYSMLRAPNVCELTRWWAGASDL